MRSATDKNEKANGWAGLLNAVMIVTAATAGFLLLTFAAALLLKTTPMPESSESVVMTVLSAGYAVATAVLMTRRLKRKPIICALYSFIAVVAFRLIMTEIINKTVVLGGQGIAALSFSAVFCLIGSVIGAYNKK